MYEGSRLGFCASGGDIYGKKKGLRVTCLSFCLKYPGGQGGSAPKLRGGYQPC